MFKTLTILIITALMVSCGGFKNFQNQKYTNLKTSKAPTKSESEISSTANHKNDASYSEEDNLQNISVPHQIDYHSVTCNETVQEENTEPNLYERDNYKAEHTTHTTNSLEVTEVIDESEITPQPIDNETEEEDEEVVKEKNKLVTAGIILLCVGFVIFPCFIAGIILIIIGRQQTKANPGKYSNERTANIVFWIITWPLIILSGLLILLLIYVAINGPIF